MLQTIGLTKIRVDQTIPSNLDQMARYSFMRVGKLYSVKKTTEGQSFHIIAIDDWWRRRISMIVSWEYAKWIRNVADDRPQFHHLASLLPRFYGLTPKNNAIILI